MKKIYWILILLMALTSCDKLRELRDKGTTNAIATVDGKSITIDQIEELTRGCASEDSARIAEAYIKQWVCDQLVLREARKKSSEEIDSLVNAYRDRLCTQAYAEQLVQKHINKRTMNDSIQAYYASHSHLFVLQESLVKGVLVVLPNAAPNMPKLKGWLKKIGDGNEEEANKNLEYLEKYVYQYAQGYELFVDRWQTENQILLTMPFDREGFRKKIQKGGLVEAKDSTTTYLLQVVDKLEFGQEMPLEFARQKIEKIVRAEMEHAILEKEREKLYQEWKD